MAKFKKGARGAFGGPDEFSKNQRLNIALRTQEKLGFEDRYAAKWNDTEIVMPNDVTTAPEAQVNRGEMRSAPTSNPSKPRALVIAYAPEDNRLIVVFRDGTWWQYNNVPTQIWLGLKNSPSTGKYLRSSGLDSWGDMGPADIDDMPASIKEQISYTSQIASSIQMTDAVRNSVNDKIERADENSRSNIRGEA